MYLNHSRSLKAIQFFFEKKKKSFGGSLLKLTFLIEPWRSLKKFIHSTKKAKKLCSGSRKSNLVAYWKRSYDLLGKYTHGNDLIMVTEINDLHSRRHIKN